MRFDTGKTDSPRDFGDGFVCCCHALKSEHHKGVGWMNGEENQKRSEIISSWQLIVGPAHQRQWECVCMYVCVRLTMKLKVEYAAKSYFLLLSLGVNYNEQSSKSITRKASAMIRKSVEGPHREATSGQNKTNVLISEQKMKRFPRTDKFSSLQSVFKWTLSFFKWVRVVFNHNLYFCQENNKSN